MISLNKLLLRRLLRYTQFLQKLLSDTSQLTAGRLKYGDIPMAQSDSKDQETKTDLQLKLARISFYKTVATLFFGSALAVFLTHIIKQQEVNMAKAKNYQLVQQNEEDNLQRYFKYTMDGDIYDRLKLAAFFKEILTESQSRDRWAAYYTLLQDQLEEWNKIADEILAMKLTQEHKKNILKYEKLIMRQEQLKELISAVSVEIAAVDAPYVETTAVAPKEKVDEIQKISDAVRDKATSWYIVFGGFSSLERAKKWIKRAKSINPSFDASVYFRKDRYRTLLGPYPSKKDAQYANIRAKKLLNNQAYVVRDSWCQEKQDKKGYYSCASK